MAPTPAPAPTFHLSLSFPFLLPHPIALRTCDPVAETTMAEHGHRLPDGSEHFLLARPSKAGRMPGQGQPGQNHLPYERMPPALDTSDPILIIPKGCEGWVRFTPFSEAQPGGSRQILVKERHSLGTEMPSSSAQIKTDARVP